MKRIVAAIVMAGTLAAALAFGEGARAQDEGAKGQGNGQSWPSRPIKLIVPFAAGGNTDVVGRITAEFLQRALGGASVVVENRPGAGGITGTAAVAKAAGDGYTLCVCGIGPISIAPSTEPLPYDPLKDLVPISLINTNPLVVVVHPSVDAKTAPDLIALSRSKPEGLTYGSPGVGGLMYFAAEIFKAKTGAKLTAVPYRGGALATAAVATGEVQLSFANMSDAVGQLSAGTVRPVGITTAERSPAAPDIPTLAEQGVPRYSIESWNALFAPTGTPRPIVERLAALMAAMAQDPMVRKRMADLGSVAVASKPDDFATQIRDEVAQWAADLKDIGIK